MKQLMLFMLAEHRLINPHIYYMKQLKHKYCCCRWLVVTFVYYEFGTLSCATNLEKVPPFVPNIPETENVPQWSPLMTWALISWHLSFWGCKCHQAARPDSLVLLVIYFTLLKVTLDFQEKTLLHQIFAILPSVKCWSPCESLSFLGRKEKQTGEFSVL